MSSINFQILVLQPQQPSLAAGRLWASCSRVTLSMYWLMTSSSPAQNGSCYTSGTVFVLATASRQSPESAQFLHVHDRSTSNLLPMQSNSLLEMDYVPAKWYTLFGCRCHASNPRTNKFLNSDTENLHCDKCQFAEMLRQDSKFPLPDEKKSFDSPTAHSQRRQLLPDNPQSAGAAYPIHDSLNKDKPEQSAADASTIPAALRSLSPFWKQGRL